MHSFIDISGLGFAIASFDYAAMAPNQISLQKGDRIKIISKAGGDKGWWKGELQNKVNSLTH